MSWGLNIRAGYKCCCTILTCLKIKMKLIIISNYFIVKDKVQYRINKLIDPCLKPDKKNAILAMLHKIFF